MEYLRRILLRFLRLEHQARRNLLLPLFDADNLVINMRQSGNAMGCGFSVDAFDWLIQQLGQRGEVLPPFVFGPNPVLTQYATNFHRLGWYPIQCPVVFETKAGAQMSRKDTVDKTLIDFGTAMLPIFIRAGLTHLVLGSGDEDFVQFARWAIRLGLKLIVVAGSRKSLSAAGFLQKLACIEGGKRQVIFLDSFYDK